MSRRLVWLIAFAVLAIGALALLRACASDTAETAAPAAAAGTAASPASPADDAERDADAAAAALAKKRGYALYEAVSALQNYLAAVGAQDWAKADPYWANASPGSGEGDLRALEKLRALRIENGNPKPLDSEPIPNAIEVPVELRASIEGESQKRYRGWYRMRRKVSGDGWEITSASIDVVPR